MARWTSASRKRTSPACSRADCFGEILYFSDRIHRRTTTITARTDITAIEIRAEAIRASTDACQAAFNKACMRVLIERLVHTNERLAKAV